MRKSNPATSTSTSTHRYFAAPLSGNSRWVTRCWANHSATSLRSRRQSDYVLVPANSTARSLSISPTGMLEGRQTLVKNNKNSEHIPLNWDRFNIGIQCKYVKHSGWRYHFRPTLIVYGVHMFMWLLFDKVAKLKTWEVVFLDLDAIGRGSFQFSR